jgi:hypothetical protein
MGTETGRGARTAADKETGTRMGTVTGRARLARYSPAGPESQAAAAAGLVGSSTRAWARTCSISGSTSPTVKLCVVNRFLYWNLTSSPA